MEVVWGTVSQEQFIAYREEIANPQITDVVDGEVKEMMQTVMPQRIVLQYNN